MDTQYESKLYTDRKHAEQALERLHSLGYERDHVSLIIDEADLPADQNFASDTSPFAAHGGMGGTGMLVGAGAGVLIGAVTAAAGIAVIALTGGAGAPLVVGPLAVALADAGAIGAVSGGIIGGLLELGVEAEDWRSGLRNGGLVVVVSLKSHADQKAVRYALLG